MYLFHTVFWLEKVCQEFNSSKCPFSMPFSAAKRDGLFWRGDVYLFYAVFVFEKVQTALENEWCVFFVRFPVAKWHSGDQARLPAGCRDAAGCEGLDSIDGEKSDNDLINHRRTMPFFLGGQRRGREGMCPSLILFSMKSFVSLAEEETALD